MKFEPNNPGRKGQLRAGECDLDTSDSVSPVVDLDSELKRGERDG